MGKSVVFDGAPDRRCHRNKLVVDEVDCRHARTIIGRHLSSKEAFVREASRLCIDPQFSICSAACRYVASRSSVPPDLSVVFVSPNGRRTAPCFAIVVGYGLLSPEVGARAYDARIVGRQEEVERVARVYRMLPV